MTFTRNILFPAALAAGVLSGCGRPAAEAPPAVAPAALVTATNPPVSALAAGAAFKKLPGKWQRADGDYMVEIRSVQPGGQLDAAYFNPQPIHVARAEASVDGEKVQALIELRDVNYPGSTYTLNYDPGKDQLTGAYFQAVTRETYEVFFVRMKP